MAKLGGLRGVKGCQGRNDDVAPRLCHWDWRIREAIQNIGDHWGLRARGGRHKEEILKSEVAQRFAVRSDWNVPKECAWDYWWVGATRSVAKWVFKGFLEKDHWVEQLGPS